MKTLLFILLSIFVAKNNFGQTTPDEANGEREFYTATRTWFSAWALVSKNIFQIATVHPVEFVLFDDKYVYSTSSITIKMGKPVTGPDLLNLSLDWKKQVHNGTITLPDKSVIPVKLMSFAAEIPEESGKSFFVMPLPSYWAKAGTTSRELGLENLITGVFIHEFSHSQQMQNFGTRITQFEKQTNFNVEFSDDVVQNLFANESAYRKAYDKEVASFYQSIQNATLNKALAKEGLQQMTKRQAQYFHGVYSSLNEIDNFFLTMEGFGQYAMYLWLIHPKGANLRQSTAISGVRRKKNRWSQDEGFALFLILGRLAKPSCWAKKMFSYPTESIVRLLDNKLP